MGECAICKGEPEENSRLCRVCNNDRMCAASMDRIFNRTGLNYSNAIKYSEENYIKSYKEMEE